MAEEMIKSVISDNAVFLKEEYRDSDYQDDKTNVFQTVNDMININDPLLLKNKLKDDTAKDSKISPVNIETELQLSDIKDEIMTDNVKTEYDDKYLFCSYCQEDYQDYCTRCQMLIHILDKNTLGNTEKRRIREIPTNILEMRELFGYVGIFTLKIIPQGVQFGPITGLTSVDRSWRIKGGKFMTTTGQSQFLHWMQYINAASNISEQNLLVFQCDGNLYYRCIREIQVGEELLVYFGEKCESLTEDNERNFIPITEEKVKDIFACTFCCLGFSSKMYLKKHKSFCPNSIIGYFSINALDIVQCSFCKIYLEQKEYIEYHMDYCEKKYTRQCILPTLNHQMPEERKYLSILNKSKRQKREAYKCVQCKYKTTYTSDLLNHTIKHYPVKMYSCLICHRKFKRLDTLKTHLVKVHNDLKECKYISHLRSRLKIRLYAQEEVKRFKCSECKYETNIKCHFNKHLNGTHRQAKKYKCTKCEFETFYQSNLKKHLYVHEEVKRFQCSECEFVTNNTPNLNRHINRKHREAKRYNCSKCEFQTSYQSNLTHHMYKHEGIKLLKCAQCDYETNRKRNLAAHVNAKHCDVKAYKCSKCVFETSHYSSFRKHLVTHEEKRGGFKCSQCDYEASNKTYLRVHVKTRHCEVKKYKCLKCDYESAYDGSFRKHLYTHEEEKRLRCSLCDFKTNYKWHLKRHMDKKHSGENT